MTATALDLRNLPDAERDSRVNEAVALKKHPRFTSYLIGEDGSVWRTQFKNGKTNYLLDEPMRMRCRLRSGYYAVNLSDGTDRVCESVHVLVLETFVGPRPDGMEGAHNDGNPLNCRRDNLRWATPTENNRDKYAHGTMPFGKRSGNAKLTDSQVEEIKSLKEKEKWPHSRLAKEYGVNQSTIGRICQGKTHSNLLHANGVTALL